jgi:Protein of unknown function (DUF1559)
LGTGGSVSGQTAAANVQRLQVPIALWHCPSRRDAKLYPVNSSISFVNTPILSGTVTKTARTDYAINGGEDFFGIGAGPDSLSQGDSGGYTFPNWLQSTGVCHVRSQMKLEMILDGTHCTYLLGEKYLSRDYYENGASLGDDQGPYISDERDSMRWGAINGSDLRPQHDTLGTDLTFSFGSAHFEVFHVAMADGSVRPISYNISAVTHRRLCNRKDGKVADLD